MSAASRKAALATYRRGILAPYLSGDAVLDIDAGSITAAAESRSAIFAADRLQDVDDYRSTLQAWFRALRTGGHLVIVVPHAFLYERQLELPSRWNSAQRRLYTPSTLLEEVEEALTPNSYRVRLLADGDAGYDYAAAPNREPVGHSDVLLVIEKIMPPAWLLDRSVVPLAAMPDYAFEPRRTRIEVPVHPARGRILILKLDHMGDFIMAISALERARNLFAEAEITLVVGSWNLETARALGLADVVLGFDAFPRNSSEQEPDVAGQTALFRELVIKEYDLAIDLRTDTDTRFLLRHVKAPLRAGIGTAAQFPFLDIFLPLDFNRNEPETAREYLYNNHDFISQGPVIRHDYRLQSFATAVERHCAIIWGPYRPLRPGRYVFEPHLELGADTGGMLLVDIGVDAERVAYATLPTSGRIRLPFSVERPDASFEFRIWTVQNMPSIDFSFFGGRLIREGAGSTLHQSEYSVLLIEIIAIRLGRTGLLSELNSA
jgi:hypothetical protein